MIPFSSTFFSFIVFLVEMAVYSSIVSTLKSASFVCLFFFVKIKLKRDQLIKFFFGESID